jgi:hypothetical protein
MKSQKLLAAVISAVIIFGTSVPVSADTLLIKVDSTTAEQQQTKITKDEAKKIAKAKFKEYLGYVLDESKLQASVNLSPYYSFPNNYTWMIYWNSTEQKKGVNLQAVIDANSGKVLSLRKNDYDNTKNQPSIPAITYESAKKSAESFLNKIAADKIKDIKLSSKQEGTNYYKDYTSLNYNLNYKRVANGIPFDGNYINIEVDGINGKVIGFDINWFEDLKLPSTGGVITAAKAEELMKKNLPLEMNYFTYISKYGVNGQGPTTKLAYNITELTSLTIDAATGEVVNYMNGSNSKTEIKNITDTEREDLYKKAVVPAPAAKEMTKNEAEAVIKNKLKLLFGDEYQVQQLSYSENTNNKMNESSSWSADFSRSNNGSMLLSGSISIDALTGGVLYFYSYDNDMKDNSNFTPQLTWEAAYYKALNAVALHFPDKIKNIDMKQTHITNNEKAAEGTSVDRIYYFSFPRTVNGIKYTDNSISVSIDTKTGYIQHMSSTWTNNISFAGTENAINTAEAQKIIFNQYKPELAYVIIPKDTAVAATTYDIKLLYRLTSSENSTAAAYIDAFTGKYLDYSGEEIIKISKEFFAKVKGNKYENELTILAYQGILDTNAFNMSKQVTRLDLIKMLVDAKGYRPYIIAESAPLKYSNITKADSNYSYLQLAVYYGFLENKDGIIDLNEKISREEMAKALVILLSYGDLAKATNIFKVNAKDSAKVDKSYIGYTAIAEGLMILQVENSNIRPKDIATSLELALGVYMVLGNLRNSVY